MENGNNAGVDKYKALFMSSRDAVMTLEPPSWKFTSANPATVAMFGAKDEADFLRYPPWELSPKLQADGSSSMGKAMEMIEKAMLNGSSLFEWTHKRVTGEDFSAEVLLSKVDEDGKSYLHAVVRDITHRKKLEAQIKQSDEEKFETIFNSVNDGILLAEIQSTRFSIGNKTIGQMLGYTNDELVSLSVSDIYPKEQQAQILEQLEKQAKGELKVAKDIPMLKKDGSIFYCDVSASSVTIGDKKYNLGVFRDVTDRKQAEDSLRKNQDLLKESQFTALLGSYVFDVHTGLWKSTEALDKVFGIDEKYVRSVDGWAELIHPEDRKMMTDYLNNEVLAEGKFFDKEYRIIRHNDNVVRWVHGLGGQKKGIEGHPVEMHGTIQDITDRKNEENNLKAKLEEIEQLNKFMVGREIKMADLKKENEELRGVGNK